MAGGSGVFETIWSMSSVSETSAREVPCESVPCEANTGVGAEGPDNAGGMEFVGLAAGRAGVSVQTGGFAQLEAGGELCTAASRGFGGSTAVGFGEDTGNEEKGAAKSRLLFFLLIPAREARRPLSAR